MVVGFLTDFRIPDFQIKVTTIQDGFMRQPAKAAVGRLQTGFTGHSGVAMPFQERYQP